MKHSLFALGTWLMADPRRTLVIAFVILTVLAVTLAVVPDQAFAGEITSGS